MEGLDLGDLPMEDWSNSTILSIFSMPLIFLKKIEFVIKLFFSARAFFIPGRSILFKSVVFIHQVNIVIQLHLRFC